MTTKAKPVKAHLSWNSIIVLTLAFAIWYPIFKREGFPMWAHWTYLVEDSEHLMLLTLLTAIVALAQLAQGDIADSP